MKLKLIEINNHTIATVVFPVPGLPVKDICNPGFPDTIPNCFLKRSISNKAAISLIRVFTGTRPTKIRFK